MGRLTFLQKRPPAVCLLVSTTLPNLMILIFKLRMNETDVLEGRIYEHQCQTETAKKSIHQDILSPLYKLFVHYWDIADRKFPISVFKNF